ncbi:MAG: DinB family protein [Ardenticatenales bacterium]|nr:DinB family protein [Ardenticatenales bacterium]
MQQDEFHLDEAVAMLGQTPARLSALLADVPERWVRLTEGADIWSPYDVIGHLIHGERTDWIPRAQHILAGEPRPFDSFDRTAQFVASQGQSVPDLLAAFAELRRENIAVLVGMNLKRADLDRTGQHPELGEVRLGQLLATWVVHDLDHLAQIVRSMALVYAEEVGPWRAYLAIL